jgi:hypothetical protein
MQKRVFRRTIFILYGIYICLLCSANSGGTQTAADSQGESDSTGVQSNEHRQTQRYTVWDYLRGRKPYYHKKGRTPPAIWITMLIIAAALGVAALAYRERMRKRKNRKHHSGNG